MQRIKVSQAAPEMVLARQVEASNGQVLCAKGTVVTESLISQLVRLQITHITVEGRPVDDGTPPKTLEEDLAELDGRFKKVAGNKLMMTLKAVVHKHIRKRHERQALEMAAGAGSADVPEPEGPGESEGPDR